MSIRSNWLIILFKSFISLLIFSLFILSIWREKCWNLPHYIIVNLFISFLSFVSFCSMYFKALFGACTFIIFTSSWWVEPFITVKCPSLSLVIFLVLKSIFSDINIVTPVFFWLLLANCIFLHPFTFNLSVSLYLKLVSER